MKKHLPGFWVVVCGVGSLTLGQPAAAQGVPTGPDSSNHCISYTVAATIDSLIDVTLEDQFLPRTPFRVRRLQKLLLPIEKFHGPIATPMWDPDLHYKWWTLEPVLSLTRSVRIRNQFSNNSNWRIINTSFILAPTLKTLTGEPPLILPNENHYLCYRAIEDTLRPPISIGWRDQFRQGTTQVMEAAYLCNPCLKTRLFPDQPPRTYPIVDPEVHLALYRIDSTFPGVQVNIRDQFGMHKTIVLQNGIEYIAVPSFKNEPPVPVVPETWGGIKSMYR